MATSLLFALLVSLSPSSISSTLEMIPKVYAFSLNQTISEKGVALKYNSNLRGYDEDVEGSGVPEIYGMIYMRNPNETKNGTNGTKEEDYIHPKWTKSNTLRVCLQYWDDAQMKNESVKNATITQVRWVLNYTFPMKYANWTPQVALLNESLTNETIKDWCSRGANWGGILEANGRTRYQNDPTLKKREEQYYKERAEAEEKARLETERTQAEIAASAPKAGDKGPDDDSDAAVAKLEADAESIAKASTESNVTLPDRLFGIETVTMDAETATQVANITFTMPFDFNETWMMDLDWEYKDYKIMLNWGVFKDENDTSKEYVFGAEYMRDQIDWKFMEPKSSVRNTLLGATTLLLTMALAISF